MISEEEQIKFPKTASQSGLIYSENMMADNIPSFLLKTYEILENQKFQDIISWTKSGEGFVVKRVKDFADQVLPVYFRHNNYTSFVRQLNMYDFHKTRQENQENAFKNSMFKKGHKHLLKQIQRKDYKKNKENNKELYNILEKPKASATQERVGPEQYSNYRQQSTGNEGAVYTDCFKRNITELKKIKNQLDQKSLKLMASTNWHSSSQMLMKAVNVLFECRMVNKKLLLQNQLLRTDFELTQRKEYFASFKQFSKMPKYLQTSSTGKSSDPKLFNELQTAPRLQRQAATEPKSADIKVSGFEKYDRSHTTLVGSFKQMAAE